MKDAQIQRKIPGLIGMATPTNGAYLRALQSHLPSTASAPRELNSLRSLLFELDFAELVRNVRASRWAQAEAQISQAALALRSAGADFLVITSNTGSTLARRASAEAGLPILDIVRPTLAALVDADCKRAGLLSTRRTLESNVYQDGAHLLGLEIVPPAENTIQRIEELIFGELVFGEMTACTVDTMVAACDWFAQHGADAIVLGCTDMTHLADQLRTRTSLFVADTAVIHASAAAAIARSGVMKWT